MDYSVIDRYIDRLMADTTPDKPIWNIENIKSGKKPGWNYIDGCMMTSLYSIYQQKNDGAYLDFIDRVCGLLRICGRQHPRVRT